MDNGCSILGEAQGQVRCGSEQPGLVQGIPAHGGLKRDDFKVPPQMKLLYDSVMKYKCFLVLFLPACCSFKPDQNAPGKSDEADLDVGDWTFPENYYNS